LVGRNGATVNAGRGAEDAAVAAGSTSGPVLVLRTGGTVLVLVLLIQVLKCWNPGKCSVVLASSTRTTATSPSTGTYLC
jgi:hypothetical protein